MAVTAPHPDDTRPDDTRPDDTRPTPTFAQAGAATDLLARFVAGLEMERYSGEDAATVVQLCTRVERIGLAGKTKAAHRVDQSNLHTRSGHRSPAEYIASLTGDPVGETKDLIKLGEQLSDQPELTDAFVNQKLSRKRATQASNAAKVNPKKERDLAEAAGRDTDAQFKERCQREKAAGRSKEQAEQHRRALHAKRYCRTYTDEDGAFRIDALFAPEAGAEIKAALEAQADRQFEQVRKEGRVETSDNYRADALFALLTGKGLLGPLGPSNRTTPDDPKSPTERGSDPKATVSVVVDLEALRRGQVEDGERCELPGVGPVSVEYAHSLLGEALVELLIARGTDVTTVYSAGRHIPQRVRSALLLRDPRCVVPGCDARLGLENDHWATEFAKGGLTSLDNLARVMQTTSPGPDPPRVRTREGRRHLDLDRPLTAVRPEAPPTQAQDRAPGPG